MESSTDPPGIFCFVMPFASLASVKHAGKLVDCLLSNSRILFVACDRRVNLNGYPANIRHLPLISLHYLVEVKPRIWSLILWLVKLAAILFRASIEFLRVSSRVKVVICFLGAYYTPILILAKLLNKKVVCFEAVGEMAAAEQVYQTKRGGEKLISALRLLTWINRSLADLIVIESSEVIRQGRLEPYLDKLRIANLYIDTGQYTENICVDSRGQAVGFLGRLSAEKGILNLLDAAQMMHSTGIHFMIAGDGPLRKEVEKLLEGPDMTHVQYLGWLGPEEITKFMNGMRIFILPTAGEGMPNSALEAMACGTPVLATPVGGLNELIVDRETGYFISDPTPAGLARSILRTLFDPNLAAVALKGKEFVNSNYSLSASSCKWHRVLSEFRTKK